MSLGSRSDEEGDEEDAKGEAEGLGRGGGGDDGRGTEGDSSPELPRTSSAPLVSSELQTCHRRASTFRPDTRVVLDAS
jgi:hypothetical protein